MAPFRVPIIIRHLIFRYPKRDHNFDNHPYTESKNEAQWQSSGVPEMLPKSSPSRDRRSHLLPFGEQHCCGSCQMPGINHCFKAEDIVFCDVGPRLS